MVRLMRHRRTKGPVSARPHLNRRATPRLHSVMAFYEKVIKVKADVAAYLSELLSICITLSW